MSAAPKLSPYFTGSFAPVEDELTVTDLEVIGEIPTDLTGAYVRNGPNARHQPRGRYHWFDGDGMLHAVYFADGRAGYQNRYVRTAHLVAEAEAGRALWSGIMEPIADNPEGAPWKDTANTDVLSFGGELVALWYISGVPYRVAPETLATLGPATFGQERARRMAAHAKVSPAGELFFFDYGVKAPYLRYGVVGADGELAHRVAIDLPGPRLPHDMAITERHAVLMDLPLFYTDEAMKQGRWIVDFHRDMPARFGVIPHRGAADEIRWFEAEPCYIYHTVNAWEDGDEVVMIGCRVAEPLPPIDPADGRWAKMMANLRITATLHCWRFNMVTGETREHTIDDRNSEFPTIDAACLGRGCRYSYNVTFADTPTLRFDSLVKYELESGSRRQIELGPGRFGSEAPFAPRDGAEAEDDGYLVSFVHDEGEARSEVVIYDAHTMDPTPLARVLLPQRVPLGFHACWAPGAQMVVPS